jgi:hypothetical protein
MTQEIRKDIKKGGQNEEGKLSSERLSEAKVKVEDAAGDVRQALTKLFV